MKSSDPSRARVTAEISIHDALAAVEHFAAAYPAERLSAHDAMRLRRAAGQMTARIAARDFTGAHLRVSCEILKDAGLEHLAGPPDADGLCVLLSPDSDGTGFHE